MNTMTIVLLIIFVFTFIPLILVEFARANSTLDLEDFFLQGRNMPLLMVFFTVYSTWFSSFAFLGATSSFYSDGPLYMTCFAWNVLFSLLFMVIGKRLWFLGKTYGYITPVDFFNGTYNSDWLNIMLTIVLTIFTLPYLMIQLYGGAYIIETVSGGLIPWRAAGLIFYLIIIIYLWAGGIRALAMTDIFYGVLIFCTMLTAGFLLIRLTGGIRKTFSLIMEADANSAVLGIGFSTNSPWAWICMFIIIPLGALMGPPMWIRAFAAKREEVFNAMPLLLSLMTILYLGPLFISSAAKVLYPDFSVNDNLIPYMFVNHLPIIIATLLLCGIAASALSTANSQIHALAAIYTMDIHKQYVNPSASNRKLVSVSKWAILFLSAVAYMLTLENPRMIIETGLIGISGTAQIIVPAVGALFWEKSNDRAAVFGLAAGVVTLCVLYFAVGLLTVYAAAIALFINTFIFVILSLSLKQNPEVHKCIREHKERFKSRNKGL